MMSVHSCFLVCFGEWPKLCWDLKVTGPLKLLFFALLKFFPPILLEQGPLLGALSVSWFILVPLRQPLGQGGVPDKWKVGVCPSR